MGKISDETLELDIIVNGNKAQAQLGALQEQQRNMRKTNEDLRKEKAKLLKQGQKESEAYKRITKEIRENNIAIKNNSQSQTKLRKEIGLSGLTTSQLAQEQKRLKAIMGSFTPGTAQWQKYSKELQKVNTTLKIARAEMNGVTKTMGSQKKSVTSLLLAYAGLTIGLNEVVQLFKNVFKFIYEFGSESVELAGLAKGVEFAFTKLGEKGTDAFNRVKKSTRGLLSDLDIKRSLVELDNFNISLEESDTLFEFLAVRATQTGRSIDSLKDSLVEGLSKESKLRIDNLGISASELNSELEKTPNFVKAVAAIAKKEVAEAGAILDLAADSSAKWNAALENIQVVVGKGLSKVTGFLQDLGANMIKTITPTKSLTTEITAQQLSLFELQSKILNVNTSSKDRVTLIKQLKSEYPNLLTNIDAEKVSNDELKAAIRNVNKELINKLIIARQQDKINSENEKAADKKIDNLQRESKLRKLVANIIKENSEFDTDASKTELQNAKTLLDFLNKKYVGETTLFKQSVRDRRALALAIRNVGATETFLANQQAKVNTLLSERDKLLKDLGISLTDVTGKSVGGSTKEEENKIRNLKVINEEITKLKELQEESTNRKEYLSLEEQINTKIKERIAITGDLNTKALENAETAQKKVLESFIKEHADLQEHLENQRSLKAAEQLKGIDEELALLDIKHAKEKQKFIITEEEKNLLSQNKLAERAAVLMELDAVHAAERDALRLTLQQELNQRLTELDNENWIEQEALRLEREAMQAETEEEKALILLERAQLIADFELQIEQAKELERLQLAEATEEEITKVKKRHALQRQGLDQNFEVQSKALKKDSVKWTEMTENQKLDFITNSLSMAADAFNEGSDAWKAAKIAETTITTYQSAVSAYAGMVSAVPGPVGIALGTVAAAFSVATGLKQVQKINNTEIQKISKPKKQKVTGHQSGLYPDIDVTRSQDGRRFNAKNGGRPTTQLVKTPTYFSDDFIAGEAGTEMIIDNPTFRKLDPQVIDHIQMVHRNVTGYQSGLYPKENQSTTDKPTGNIDIMQMIANQNEMLLQTMAGVQNHLANPITPNLVFGYPEAEGVDNLNKERKESEQNGILT